MKMRSGISSHKPTNAIHSQSRALLATSLDIAVTPAPLTGGDSRSAASEKRHLTAPYSDHATTRHPHRAVRLSASR